MILPATARQSKKINRGVYGLLITLVLMFMLVIIMLESQNDQSAQREMKANDYHLAISNKSLQLLRIIDRSKLWFRDHNSGQHEKEGGIGTEFFQAQVNAEFSERDHARALSIEIEKLVGDVRTIHGRYAGNEFDKFHQILEQTKRNFKNDINTLQSADSYTTEKLDDILAPLIAITHQLQRLHQQTYQEMRLSLVDFQRQKQEQITILIVILVVAGLIGIVKMLRLVSGTLTELGRAQIELHDKEARLREAQRVARLGYIERFPMTNEINWSEETYNICGFPRDYKPTVESSIALVHPDDAEKVAQALNATIQDKADYNLEYRIIRPDNREVFIQAKGEISVDEEGRVNRLLSTIVDITGAKIAEAELLKYQNHLEELVAERTKEIESLHQEFVRKERLATLGQLTGTVSHELRNPLGAIKSALYVIQKIGDQENERVQKAIGRADRNIDRCTLIIEELLDFTRAMQLNKHATRFDEWLESVIKEQSIPQGIQIVTDFGLKEVKISIDPDRLRRAVINIVDNACHSMLDNNKSGDPLPDSQLVIKTSGDDNRIEITVSDNGHGISESLLSDVFEPLFSTKSFGVGLGMPTVKQVMEQHGGGVEIDSDEEQGTTVTLWLPRSLVTDNDDGAAA
jgi:signal transduction histidine kinase